MVALTFAASVYRMTILSLAEPWTSSKRDLVNWVLRGYAPVQLRVYCYLRLAIFDPVILGVLERNLRDRKKVLDIGCGAGIFSCIFSALNPDAIYWGLDINPRRIKMARQAAFELKLPNVHFLCADARHIELDMACDAIMMVDFLHHIDDASKLGLFAACARHLKPDGVLIIKDIAPCPRFKFIFTLAMDAIMTGGFDLWYWETSTFQSALSAHFHRVETIPIGTWMPYSHVIYLCNV